MHIHNLTQGSTEWHALRAKHYTASEAAAMLGVSKYQTRSALLKQKATGLAPEVGEHTQRLFDRGHETEAQARAMAEAILGEELYPVTGTALINGVPLLASMDGLTMAETINWEHKLWNEGLATQVRDGTLDEHYTVQMDQQQLVSGAAKTLFMVSDGTPERMVWCWYVSSQERKDRLLAGWAQFDKDVAAYQPTEVAPAVVANAVEALPSVVVSVTGSIAIRDNFAAFQQRLEDFLGSELIREPKTDQDFADLDLQIKALKGAEAALDAAEQQMLAQIQTVDQAKRTKDALQKLVRDNRLMAEKLLSAEKERRKSEIVSSAQRAAREHYEAHAAELGVTFSVDSRFHDVIKGLKSLASMEDRLSAELARVKVECDRVASVIGGNRDRMKIAAAEHLFPDFAQVCTKAHEDFEALIVARQAAAQKRADEERERIRQEVLAKIEREEAASPDPRSPNPFDSAPVEVGVDIGIGKDQAATAVVSAGKVIDIKAGEPNLRIGEICRRTGVTVGAELLGKLGFPAVQQGASRLYHEADYTRILLALAKHFEGLALARAA